MRDSKGISMISLIVTIVCTILIASVAIGTGSKYIRESKNKDRATFVTVMSNAVAKRNGDFAIDEIAYPYLGYHINNAQIFESVFAPKIKEKVNYEDGLWYVVDATTAKSLGVKEPERYIDVVDVSYSEEVTLVLADYLSGKVYLFKTYSAEMSGDTFTGGQVSGHKHRYIDEENFPNCTEPLKCDDCGFIKREALGHTYEGNQGPEPAVGDEARAHYNRNCTRCGMQGGYELHKFEYQHLIKTGLWYHKSKCIVCNYPETIPGYTNEERCTEFITLSNDINEREINHIRSCKVCGHTVTEPHDIGYRRISEIMHEKYCKNPLCNYQILKEYHYDNDGDGKCDACESEIVSYAQPILQIVEIENITPSNPNNKYIAKYGDTIRLKFTADKPVKKETMVVKIAGYTIPQSALTTANNTDWQIDFNITPGMTIPNSEINFSIICESSVGIEMSEPITTTTNNRMVVFDGSEVIGIYIPKTEVNAMN